MPDELQHCRFCCIISDTRILHGVQATAALSFAATFAACAEHAAVPVPAGNGGRSCAHAGPVPRSDCCTVSREGG